VTVVKQLVQVLVQGQVLVWVLVQGQVLVLGLVEKKFLEGLDHNTWLPV
jgi:hypothetical protein